MLENALDPVFSGSLGPARRCGVVRTRDVQKRTTVLLVRLRFHVIGKSGDGQERKMLAEDLVVLGFTGSAAKAEWLSDEQVEPLLLAEPHANIGPDVARHQLETMLAGWEILGPHLRLVAEARGKALLVAHKRVRKLVRGGQTTTSVEASGTPDVLGFYVYLPADAGGVA
jgi:hypothetical protein